MSWKNQFIAITIYDNRTNSTWLPFRLAKTRNEMHAKMLWLHAIARCVCVCFFSGFILTAVSLHEESSLLIIQIWCFDVNQLLIYAKEATRSIHSIAVYSIGFESRATSRWRPRWWWWWVCTAHYALTSSNLYRKSNLCRAKTLRAKHAFSIYVLFFFSLFVAFFRWLQFCVPNVWKHQNREWDWKDESKTIRLQFSG